MQAKDLKSILEAHALFLDTSGRRGKIANLRWVNLSGADLSYTSTVGTKF